MFIVRLKMKMSICLSSNLKNEISLISPQKQDARKTSSRRMDPLPGIVGQQPYSFNITFLLKGIKNAHLQFGMTLTQVVALFNKHH